MNEKTKTEKYLLEQPFLSEKKFKAVKVRTIVGLLVLVTTFVLSIYYWRSLAWYIQIILGFIILSLSPGIQDFKFFKVPYAVYKEEWSKFHESKNKS